MRCERVQFYYEDYCRLSLPVSTLGRIEEHLAGCPACREYFEQNDQIAQLLRESSDVAHPGQKYFHDLSARVLTSLDEAPAEGVIEIPPTKARGTWGRPLWWAGAAAAAGLLCLSFVPQMHTPNRQLALKLASPASTDRSTPGNPGDPPGAVASMLANNLIMAMQPDGTLVDKGAANATRKRADIESLIRSQLNYPLEMADGMAGMGTLPDGQIPGSAAIQPVSLRPGGARIGTVPDEVLRQLEKIKTELADQSDTELVESLRQFDQTIQRLSAENASLAEMPMVQQARQYLKGEKAFSTGQAEEAWGAYRRVASLDPASPLAMRANLQMADLFYYEWANFGEAQNYYKLCQGSKAEKALTGADRDHVTRQLDRLQRYSENYWNTLHLDYCVRRGEWPESLAALRSLTAEERARDLLPEAARTIVERMKSSPAPSVETTNEVYNLLAKRAQIEQNGEVRAWLNLALGDLLNDQLKNTGQAGIFYKQAIAAAGNTDAAKVAKTKLWDLEESNLNDLARK